MKYLFLAHTTEGYNLKVLTESLNKFYQTVYLQINSDGISITESDSGMRILTDTLLKSLNFNRYKCAGEHIVPVKCDDLYQAFKPVRKKDPITLYIDEEYPDLLCIMSVPLSEQSKKSTTKLRIIRERRAKPEINAQYTVSPINIPGKDFSRMCKDLTRGIRVICVRREGQYIRFSNSENDLIRKEIEFNTKDEYDEEEDLTTYNEQFEAGHITNLAKIASSDKMCHVYAEQGLPLHISLDLGNLGEVRIYITSVDQQNRDSDSEFEEMESDEDSD